MDAMTSCALHFLSSRTKAPALKRKKVPRVALQHCPGSFFLDASILFFLHCEADKKEKPLHLWKCRARRWWPPPSSSRKWALDGGFGWHLHQEVCVVLAHRFYRAVVRDQRPWL